MEGALGAHRGCASLILPEETPLHLFPLNELNESDKLDATPSLAETVLFTQQDTHQSHSNGHTTEPMLWYRNGGMYNITVWTNLLSRGGIVSAMYPRVCMILVGLALSGVVQVVGPKTSVAIPAWSRQTGEPCSTCHDVLPKLNHTGQNFRANGFRFPDRTERDTAQDGPRTPPSDERKIDATPPTSERCTGDFCAIRDR
jgi:hypothetical protein